MWPDAQTAHTPSPGPLEQTKKDNLLMTALHTPLVGPGHAGMGCTGPSAISRARDVQSTETDILQCVHCTHSVQSDKRPADSRKLDHLGSPEELSSITFDKTPTMVGGKLEKFGNIQDMITRWERQDEERCESRRGEGGTRRISQRISELSKYYEGEEQSHSDNPGVGGEGLGEGGPKREEYCSPFLKTRPQNSTKSDSCFANNTKFSIINLSTNDKPAFTKSVRYEVWTNQGAGSPKRKYVSDAPGTRKRLRLHGGSTRMSDV